MCSHYWTFVLRLKNNKKKLSCFNDCLKVKNLSCFVHLHKNIKENICFKAHVLSYIERNTPAIFHCNPSVLCILDNVQFYFLEAVQISLKDVLLQYHLAPLSSKRHIAMLGLIHRIVTLSTTSSNLQLQLLSLVVCAHLQKDIIVNWMIRVRQIVPVSWTDQCLGWFILITYFHNSS